MQKLFKIKKMSIPKFKIGTLKWVVKKTHLNHRMCIKFCEKFCVKHNRVTRENKKKYPTTIHFIISFQQRFFFSLLRDAKYFKKYLAAFTSLIWEFKECNERGKFLKRKRVRERKIFFSQHFFLSGSLKSSILLLS